MKSYSYWRSARASRWWIHLTWLGLMGCSVPVSGESGGVEPTFADFASCMANAGCVDVASCPKSGCHEEADSEGRLIALWACPGSGAPACDLPPGDRLAP